MCLYSVYWLFYCLAGLVTKGLEENWLNRNHLFIPTVQNVCMYVSSTCKIWNAYQ
jgi:hypothetical protein